MTYDDSGGSVASSRPEPFAQLSAALVRQVGDATSFREAVHRSVITLLDDGEAARLLSGQVVPAARAGGSESLPTLSRADADQSAALIDVLGDALHALSPSGDRQSATRVAEVVVRMSASWFAMSGTMLREHYVEATVDMAVALAASKSVFAPLASQR